MATGRTIGTHGQRIDDDDWTDEGINGWTEDNDGDETDTTGGRTDHELRRRNGRQDGRREDDDSDGTDITGRTDDVYIYLFILYVNLVLHYLSQTTRTWSGLL